LANTAPKGFHNATTYLQVEPVFGRNWDAREMKYVDVVESIKIVAATQKRPTKPRRSTVIAKITLQMPDGAFLPLAPEAIVVIPENMTMTAPIEVVAEDPNEEQQ
jgi:hypothetical protein